MAFCGLVLVEAINSQKYGNQMLKFIIHGLDLSLKTFSMIFRELQTTAVPLNCNGKHYNFGTLMARTKFYTNCVTRSSPYLKFPTMIKFQNFNLAEKDKSQGIISV